MPSALITGTSTGIGLETALLFARRGYRVYACARDPGSSEGLRKAVADGLPLTSVALDVDNDASVLRAVERVGPVDVLVNNAGIGGAAPVELMPMENIRWPQWARWDRATTRQAVVPEPPAFAAPRRPHDAARE